MVIYEFIELKQDIINIRAESKIRIMNQELSKEGENNIFRERGKVILT